jgi:hypothetical protein
MTNTIRVTTDPEEHFGLVVAKLHQLAALLQAIRKGADPACSSDGLEGDKLSALVDVAESVLNDADVALADYHEAVSIATQTLKE